VTYICFYDETSIVPLESDEMFAGVKNKVIDLMSPLRLKIDRAISGFKVKVELVARIAFSACISIESNVWLVFST
jgi:hypothetical protein